jgi:hypothetical protein
MVIKSHFTQVQRSGMVVSGKHKQACQLIRFHRILYGENDIFGSIRPYMKI